MRLKKVELDKIIMVGDKLLLKPISEEERTDSGLYLPPTIKEKETLSAGYVIKVGPGFPIPTLPEEGEEWKPTEKRFQYFPLQAQKGDLAVYIQKHVWEIFIEGEKYVVAPYSSIVLLVRDESLFT